MSGVKVLVNNKDEYIVAMVKALAYQSGTNPKERAACVRDVTLDAAGHLTFHFNNDTHCSNFKRAVFIYLRDSASIVDG